MSRLSADPAPDGVLVKGPVSQTIEQLHPDGLRYVRRDGEIVLQIRKQLTTYVDFKLVTCKVAWVDVPVADE